MPPANLRLVKGSTCQESDASSNWQKQRLAEQSRSGVGGVCDHSSLPYTSIHKAARLRLQLIKRRRAIWGRVVWTMRKRTSARMGGVVAPSYAPAAALFCAVQSMMYVGSGEVECVGMWESLNLALALVMCKWAGGWATTWKALSFLEHFSHLLFPALKMFRLARSRSSLSRRNGCQDKIRRWTGQNGLNQKHYVVPQRTGELSTHAGRRHWQRETSHYAKLFISSCQLLSTLSSSSRPERSTHLRCLILGRIPFHYQTLDSAHRIWIAGSEHCSNDSSESPLICSHITAQPFLCCGSFHELFRGDQLRCHINIPVG